MADISQVKLPDNNTYDINAKKVNGHTVATDVPSNAVFTDTNTHRPIQVNGTQILGDNTTALNLKSGSNVSLSNSSGTVTIAATDTTYSSKAAASGGTDVSLCTTGEKYTWNNKSNLTLGTTSTTALKGDTKYAGSSSAGGSATSAVKLDTATAGSATQPCYFTGGKPSACTYSLNKTVPSNAKFTDTTYSSKAAASGGTSVSLCTTGEKYTWNNKSNLALGTTATTALKGNATAQDIKYISGGTDSIYDVINETQQVIDGIDAKISALYRMSTKISINGNSSKTVRVGQDSTSRVGFIVFGQGAQGICSPIFYLIGGYVTASRCSVINISGKTGITIDSSSTSNLNFVFTNTAGFGMDLYFFPLYDNTFTPS